MGDLKRVEELDKLIPLAHKELRDKQSQYSKLLNERKHLIDNIIQCHKVRFANKKAATNRIKQLKKRGLEFGSAYHCERCLGWHLTSRKE